MAADNEIIGQRFHSRDDFDRLPIIERRQRLTECVESLSNVIQDYINDSEEYIIKISEVLPDDEELGDVRFRRITRIIDLACRIFIDVAKALIGFRWSDDDSQIISLRKSMAEMTTLWMAGCYDTETDSIILPDKEEYIRESFILAGFDDIANDLLNFAQIAHKMKISSTEISYLYTLSLFNNVYTLAGRETIMFCREEYMGSFEDYIATKYESKALDRIAELLEIQSKAQEIGKKFQNNFNQKHKDKKLPALFKEVWILDP